MAPTNILKKINPVAFVQSEEPGAEITTATVCIVPQLVDCTATTSPTGNSPSLEVA